MARKRSVFFRAIQSLLKLIRLRVCGGIFGDRLYLRGLILLLLGIVITTGIPPVLSQMPVGSSITREPLEQVQKLQELGRYYQACKMLVGGLKLDNSICDDKDLKTDFEQIVNIIQQQQNSIQIIGSFGNILREIGRLEESQKFLEQGLKMTQSPEAEGDMLLSLGNTLTALGNLERDRQASPVYDYMPWRCVNPSKVDKIPEKASKFYQEADERYQQAINKLPSSSATRIKAELNSLNLALEMGDKSAAKAIANEKINLFSLPNNRTKVYARINLAKSLTCLQQSLPAIEVLWEDIINQLNKAVQESQELKDEQAKSYALGNFAGLYEYLGWLNEQHQQQKTTINLREKALELTRKALYLAQSGEAPEIAYQWQWQLGRLFEAQGNNQEAIANYEAAVESLKSVRSNLLTINSDVQFSFRDNVEPVYRRLVDLLLKESNPGEGDLKTVIGLIDSLQLAELENFLRCNLSQSVQNEQEIDKQKAAFIYPIILKDRLEVIFELPGKHLERRQNDINQDAVETTLKELQIAIYRNYPTVREKSQQVYGWLIEPIEEELKQNNEIETLVFVLDGYLRNIPMAVLYDGKSKEYLIQKKYALALLPSSPLFDLRPSPGRLKVLAAGISEEFTYENLTFGALKADDEIKQIEKVVPTQQLLNAEFTKTNLQKQVNSGAFSVVHMATHGNFSSDPKQTYILVYHDFLKAKELNNLLRGSNSSDAIELLVLSACTTAQGDNRATLGLAGLAVRAGARTTIATLWKVEDEFTVQLMKQFYNELNKPGVTKAEALHRAQKALLMQGINEKDSSNPRVWAPYVLVGNWR